MQRTAWIWLSLLAVVLNLSDAGLAAAPDYGWRALDVGIEVEPSGDLLITETQRYDVSGQQTLRLQRAISLANVDRIADVAVWENEKALPVKTNIKDDQFRIRWRAPRPSARQTAETRTFVVRYRVQGAIRMSPGGDHIMWTALFGERDTPLPHGSVTLRLPEPLAGAVQASRSYGAPATVRRLDDRTLAFTPSAALQPDEALTVKVVVPHGQLRASMSKWQQGIDVPYTLPGLLGRVDTAVLIVIAIVMFASILYIIGATRFDDGDEIAQHMGMDRDDGIYRPGDGMRQPPG